MHKVIIETKVHGSIHNFINSYKNSFLDTFTDTGIYYEDLIRKNYIENSKKFQREIYNILQEKLEVENILGYKVLKNKNFQIIITSGNYRLFIEYSENSKEKTRYIENIIFHKK